MPKGTWIFASVLSGVVLLALGILQMRAQNQARAAAQAAVAAARAEIAEMASLTNAWFTELQAAQARAAELEQAVQLAAQTQASLEQQMRTALESRDITISELQGKLTVNILDHVLFDSGEARLKDGGEAILLKVARVLADYPERAIQVIGHTDDVPIRSRTAEGFTDNWSLSAGRAVSAVRFLVEKAGVDPRRTSAVGCGEFRPVASNATAEGRARNRRIAVVILPEELTKIETPSEADPGSPAAAAPPDQGSPESAP